MKRFIFAVILLVAGMSVASAQVRPGMKYNELKSVYSFRDYNKSANDPYSPGWNAFASYVLPGLGQALSREPGRGLRFFATSTAVSAFGYYEADKLLDNLVKDANGDYARDADGGIMFKDEGAAKRQVMALIASGVAEAAVCLWSCVDAARVAKIKNLYSRDVRSYTLEPSLYPSVQTVKTGSGYQLAPGVTFALNF